MNQQLVVVLLIGIAVAGLMYVLVYPYLSGDIKAQKRQKALMAGASDRSVSARGTDPTKRRKMIADSLKEVEEKNKKKKVDLQTRITQAGLAWTKQAFLIGSVLFGLLLGFFVFVVSRDPIVAAGGVAVGVFGIPNWALAFLRKRRINKFIEEFPGAIDVIIRGVKAGLPVADCFRMIASEGQEPVRGEFRRIVESQTIGLSIGEAVERFAERVPVAEASFFSIVINIQQKAGGNLSEALSNLSRVLRDRKKMKGKVKAMSSEAKSSAGIIGSLPFLVGGAVYLTTPSYMMILFTTNIGKIIIACGLLWMAIGIFIMRKMINFDI
ncbi:type II secretion system F family protein [Methylocystis parvus]|uniref:Type II secretion system F family protein n=1 Tax=Methylocystis parvus TaxID=134 RepID=A0A6B8M7L8_9HYPH|nr:type II secretion system F family protein [Methylocystis parvus]QGM98518.1 type II secretion system F family protein [Methylocystis parvus]WBK01143.1 type II secretion system F family protein [Methylocystis parvus OBBP]